MMLDVGAKHRAVRGLAARLKEARTRAGLSQKELAALSGVSQPLISQLERGKRRSPEAKTVQALEAVLGADLLDRAPNVPERQDAYDPDLRARIASAAEIVDEYLDSEFAKLQKPRARELAWLRSVLQIKWVGKPPTAETIYHMVEAIRKG